MMDFMYCKLCLTFNVKMYDVNTPRILEAYSKLLPQMPLSDQTNNICYECAYLLQKYAKFHRRCSIAHLVLSSIPQDSGITQEAICKVNRKAHKLESSLTVSPLLSYSDELSKDCDDDFEKFLVDEIILKENTSIVQGTEDEVQINGKIEVKSLNNENSVLNDFSDELNESENCLSELLLNYKVKKKHRTFKKESKKRKIKNSDIDLIVKEEYNDVEDYVSDLDDQPLAISLSNTTNKDKSLAEIKSTEIQETGKRKCGPKFDASCFDGYATVVLLTPEQAKQEVLLRKESSNYQNCPYKCDMCYRGFEAKGTFENHMKKHDEKNGEWKCNYCHLRFPKQSTLCKHEVTCHKRKFYCKVCPYTCFCTNQAKTHMSLHKGKKYPCDKCGELFSMPNSLLMHKRVKHATECVCALCGSTFATARGLASHANLVHRHEINEEKGPKCEDCVVQFSTETAWKRHLVLSSKHKVSNGCETCGETFSDAEALKRHTKLHSRKQTSRSLKVKLPAACTICDKWLSDLNEYKSHMVAQHPLCDITRRIASKDQKQFVCELCGKSFVKQCFLQYHQRKHTGERPLVCGECGMRFALPSALSLHRLKHTNARSHQCDRCHKNFASRSSLRKHIKAHLGIRPHKCSICGKAFPNPCEVKLHMKYVHCKVPWPKRDRSKRNAEESAAHTV